VRRPARSVRPVALEGADERGTPYEIVTPEGVPLAVRIAGPSDRAAAFLLDALYLFLAMLVVVLAAMALGRLEDSLTGAFLLLGVFLLRNGYFVWFEARHGATPGKRRTGIRVIDARGGALTFEAVVARNLLREIEVFLPLGVILAPEAIWPGAPGWLRLVCVVWALLLATMPLYNRRRLRAGDMVAGTLVVRQPKALLLRDVGESTAGAVPRPPSGPAGAPVPASPAPPEFSFTDEQLDVYGNYELQVLEEVLRGTRSRESGLEAQLVVAERIRRKIGWVDPVPPPRTGAFLRAFYAALRARLESRMLLGRRKEDKHS
jgi:uncharacterized RDD family membrane protein YckC